MSSSAVVNENMESIDLAINAIENRFNQPGFCAYRLLESYLLHYVHADKSDNEKLAEIKGMYNTDIYFYKLQAQLPIFRTMLAQWVHEQEERKPEEIQFSDVLRFMQSMVCPVRSLMSEVTYMIHYDAYDVCMSNY